MNVGAICTREVVHVGTATTVMEAAALMRKEHVGDLLVTDEIAGKVFPLGIVTDRDIVIEVVATNVDPNTLSVGDIMGQKLVTAGESEDVFETLQRMRNEGVRRMPVVDEEGGLIGIVTFDDLLEILAEQLGEMVRLISWGRMREERTRIAPLAA